jgi:hypothetical protein
MRIIRQKIKSTLHNKVAILNNKVKDLDIEVKEIKKAK